jgi:hypothetical protein
MNEPSMDLRDRLKAVLRAGTPARGHFRTLEEMSGISIDSWKALAYDRQKPSPEMLSFAFATWPEAAFWLATGLEDERFGHVAPAGVSASEKSRHKPNEKTAQYFQLAIELQRRELDGQAVGVADMARLNELMRQRLEQIETNQREVQSDSRVEFAHILDEAALQPTEGSLPLMSKLVAELQAQRQWTDAGMAEALEMKSVEDYVRARDGQAGLLDAKQIARIIDRWAYDSVRDALLKVLPKSFAKRVRDFDIRRGLR